MLEDDSVEQRSYSTFPSGEGGPLAVDEVKSDISFICAHYLSFLLSTYVWDLKTVVDACPYSLCHILGFASLFRR